MFYRPQTKLREGNVFTPVCDSVYRGRGGCIPACIGQEPDTPRQTPPRQTPSPPEMATEARGTHPTECIIVLLKFLSS